jgi:hypothetical protein
MEQILSRKMAACQCVVKPYFLGSGIRQNSEDLIFWVAEFARIPKT